MFAVNGCRFIDSAVFGVCGDFGFVATLIWRSGGSFKMLSELLVQIKRSSPKSLRKTLDKSDNFIVHSFDVIVI